MKFEPGDVVRHRAGKEYSFYAIVADRVGDDAHNTQLHAWRFDDKPHEWNTHSRGHAKTDALHSVSKRTAEKIWADFTKAQLLDNVKELGRP